jgi:hypothetical protein
MSGAGRSYSFAPSRPPGVCDVAGAPLTPWASPSDEQPDGTPADPPTVELGVYVWKPGDTITLGAGRSLRVLDVREQGDDQPTVLVIEDMA